MIKKLVISAAVLAALISAKETHAAGVAGFARALPTVMASQIHISQFPSVERQDAAGADILTLDVAKRGELLRVNSAVNGTMTELDGYFDSIAGVSSPAQETGCDDCADLKRKHLISLGWSGAAMRIAHSVDGAGRIERVLVIATDRGDLILGNDSPLIDLSGKRVPAAARDGATPAAPSFIDL